MIDGSTRSFALLLVLAAAALPTGARGADSDPAEGMVQIGSGHAEVLSRSLPVGKRIELPEGWFRVEEGGVEDGRVGSFTIVSSSDEEETPAAVAPTRVDVPAPPREAAVPVGAAPPAPAPPCRPERNAYLRQLWKENGIEVSDPDALIEGLDAGTAGPATGYYWFALATDTFRNLAFSSDLRGRAEALVRCVRAARGE